MNNLNITDILPQKKEAKDFLPFDLNRSVELTEIGLEFRILQDYQENLRISKERKIPIFIFNDLSGTTTGISLFSSTFKEHLLYGETASFFFRKPEIPYSAIGEVIICPDPIELLSYYQINRNRLNQQLLIAPHPNFKLASTSVLLEYFPNARFRCLFPRNTPYDILCSMAINLSLTKQNYSIKLFSPNIHIALERSTHIIRYEEIDYRFFRKVMRNGPLKVKNISPPKNFYSFNQIINAN